MKERLESIRKIAAQAPNDPFPQYGLAMELKNAGQLEEARQVFSGMAEKFPDYVAQYLMHAQLLIGMERRDDARGVLERGIAAARKAGNMHALGELESALDGL